MDRTNVSADKLEHLATVRGQDLIGMRVTALSQQPSRLTVHTWHATHQLRLSLPAHKPLDRDSQAPKLLSQVVGLGLNQVANNVNLQCV